MNSFLENEKLLKSLVEAGSYSSYPDKTFKRRLSILKKKETVG